MSDMKDINTLYEKYPQLFPTNCIECNIGWYTIIDHMCLAIQTYIIKEIGDEIRFPEFVSIRENFGVLDIRIEDSDSIINIVKKSCEILSYHTCEYCGDEGELYCSSKFRSWSYYKTLCLDHAIEHYYYRLYRNAEFSKGK
tara:strand:+ start:277 stop:699 length:423 start_codon:yes stop_codon:yes gene_type:complete